LFAFLAGENLYVMQNAAMAAQAKYDSIFKTSVHSLSGNQAGFSVFPNPAREQLILKMNTHDCETIFIYRCDGVKMVEMENNGEETIYIDLTAFPSGIYFIQVHSLNGISSQKFIIEK
jgi:hypothetical protein